MYASSAFEWVIRARQPPEQVRLVLESLAIEAQSKVNALMHQSIGNVGKEPTAVNNNSNSRMSALDLENMINDIIQTLLQDPSFISLLEWLATLPPTIHQVKIRSKLRLLYLRLNCLFDRTYEDTDCRRIVCQQDVSRDFRHVGSRWLANDEPSGDDRWRASFTICQHNSIRFGYENVPIGS